MPKKLNLAQSVSECKRVLYDFFFVHFRAFRG